MRIVILTQMFPPEMGAPSSRMQPIVRVLTARGHQVFVATGMPNYPAGTVFPGYRGKWFMREEKDGYTILRTAYYTVPRNQSKWPQLFSYLSFIPAVFHSAFRAGPVDVVFVTSPPIFPCAAAICLAWLRGARLVFDVRDLWPDEIVACGAGREGSLPVRLIRLLERWIYRASDLVSCTTQAFVETVVSRGVDRRKTLLIPNGADLSVFRPLPRDNPVAAADSLGDGFVVMYCGLLGIKHGLETVLEAAQLLQSEKDISLVLVGNGARRLALEQFVAEHKMQNVRFLGERDPQDLPWLLARADLCVTSLLPEPYLEKILPVKIFEYMACGKPIVAALAGEGARVIREFAAGVVVPPGNAPALAEAIRTLRDDPERRKAMGESGHRLVAGRYSREATAEELESALQNLFREVAPHAP